MANTSKPSIDADMLPNPYAGVFGEYDYHYYNSKVPRPAKESLGMPSSRRQVQLLNEWFECMMEQYVDM